MRLLVVEDEKRIADFLARGLQGAGYAVDVAPNGMTALDFIHATDYDLVILDIMLPDLDGLTILEKIRNRKVGPPVLILSARGAVDDRVKGLELGADDYLTKPFAMTELIARIKALLRRPGSVLGITLEAGNIRLDTVGRELTVAGISIRLSRQELAVLEQMMRRVGRIVPKAVLEERLYGIDEEPESNTIPVHVHHLRRQLAAASANVAIHTVRGVGYILAEIEQ